jgi:hypothetical protein
VDVSTSSGLARFAWHREPHASVRALMVLGHSAGGGIDAPDLLRAADIAADCGLAVALAEQPYRVQGRRAPAPAAQLDAAFTEVTAAARADLATPFQVPLMVGGRSSGARVACRIAKAAGAEGVLALAFPLRPQGNRGAEGSSDEPPSRLPELLGTGVPALVIQGDSDAFGTASELTQALKATPSPPAEIMVSTAVGADHSLRDGVDAATIAGWLSRFLP